jgi:hypothetical protein
MFRRGQYALTLLLTAVYLGQSLFLGALHFHPSHTDDCVHHVHAKQAPDSSAGSSHECCHQSGRSSQSEPSSQSRPHTPCADGRHTECAYYSGARSVGDPHSDCAICQYLTQGALPGTSTDDISNERAAHLVSELHSSFVSPRPFSWPRPRSPPPVLGNSIVA